MTKCATPYKKKEYELVEMKLSAEAEEVFEGDTQSGPKEKENSNWPAF